MPSDLEPIKPAGSWITEFNLPEAIAGPAGKAISRLIGEAVDIPSAYINRYAQRIKNKTEAEQVMSKVVAEAAARQAVADPELVRRAANSFLAKELRGQSNKEAIAGKTIEELKAHPQAETTQQPGNPEEPEDDWLNVFERYAEDASSERLQSIWARVLAGQIRKPKAFSLQALRFIAELSPETAQVFERVAPRVLNRDFVPYPPKQGPVFDDLLALEEVGLLTGTAGTLHKIFKMKSGRIMINYSSGVLLFTLNADIEVQISAVILTRLGKEIYELAAPHDHLEFARKFVENFPKANVEEIRYAAINQPSIVLYAKPPEEAPKDN